jgi:UDP-N-acetylmuramate--alanine ligase
MVAPVYAAGEDPIEGINSQALAHRIRAGGHRDAHYIDGQAAIAPAVRDLARAGDFIVFLGAGTITQWAYALPKELGGEAA